MNAVAKIEAHAIETAAPLEVADPTRNLILVPLSRLVSRPTGRNVRKSPRMSIPAGALHIEDAYHDPPTRKPPPAWLRLMPPAQYVPAGWMDGPHRPDRPASHHGPRLAAPRVVDHRNQGLTSRAGPKPFRLGAGGRKLRALRWPRPVSLLKGKTPHRRLRSGGEGCVTAAPRPLRRGTQPRVSRHQVILLI